MNNFLNAKSSGSWFRALWQPSRCDSRRQLHPNRNVHVFPIYGHVSNVELVGRLRRRLLAWPSEFFGYRRICGALAAQQNLGASIALGGAVSGILACVVSLVLLRTRGIFYSVGTWLIAEMLGLAVLNIPEVGSARAYLLKA